MRIPYKPNILQHDDTFVCHRRLLAFNLELVLITLAFHPSCQRRILCICMRYLAVSKTGNCVSKRVGKQETWNASLNYSEGTYQCPLAFRKLQSS
jgi:hypothetical protein